MAWSEVEEERTQEGLWAKVFVENDGNEEKTKVSYIKARVENLQTKRNQEIEEEEKRLKLEKKEEKALILRLREYPSLLGIEQSAMCLDTVQQR
jgi:arginyl-tRNA synthetase